MGSELVQVVCAWGAFLLPITMAWHIVWWQGRSRNDPDPY